MNKLVRRICVLVLSFALLAGSFSGQYVQAAKKKKPTFSKKRITVTVKASKKLTVKKAKGYKLRWKVKNKKLVTLKKSGKYGKKIVGKKAGNTVVTCTAKKGRKNYKLTCKVKVVKKNNPNNGGQNNKTPEDNNGQSGSNTPGTNGGSNNGTNQGSQNTPNPNGNQNDTSATPTPIPTATPKPQPTADPNFTPVSYQNISFESGTDGFTGRGGSETLKSVSGGYSGKCLSVSGRKESWHGASLNLTDSVVRSAVYKVSAWVKQDSGSDKELKVSCTLNANGKETYPEIGIVTAKSGEWTKFEATYAVPRSFTSLSIYFESPEGSFDFYLDEMTMTQVSGGIELADPEKLPSLKDTYAEYFDYMGTCISYQHYQYGNQMQDASLMNIVTKQFNSFTLENEMKPETILNGSTTITKEAAKSAPYNYIIPDNYTESKVLVLNFTTLDKILELAHEKGLKMRGHTLLWHQQTALRFFKTNYSDSGSTVSKAVMDARLEFYVRTVMNHVLKKEKELTGSAGSIVYAWDIANEYTHRSNNPTVPSWVDIYGDMKLQPSYVKAAYTYAYDELKKAGVEDKVTLFYNDYNTYEEADNIVSLINYINSDGKICRGVGMQSHLDVDYPSIESYGNTIDTFKNAGLEIQITELDITINYPKGSYNPNMNRTDEDQAEYYYQLMKTIIAKKKAGANITGITIWGLYDGVSWRGNYSPLLFASGMNDPKASFYRVIDAAKEAVEN